MLVQQAEAEVISLTQAIAQTENNISLLLGKNPQDIPRGLTLVDQAHLPVVPAGLPSALLERRPDVRRDEELLVAANANVGVAKAAFFPQISLTGVRRAQHRDLQLPAGPATFWALGGQVTQPIFQGGRIRANYHLAWAQRDEAELTYKKTVLDAFGDVSNSLVGLQRFTSVPRQDPGGGRHLQGDGTPGDGALPGRRHQLSRGAGHGSSTSLRRWPWQRVLAEMQNYVQLYQALGGGWDQQ